MSYGKRVVTLMVLDSLIVISCIFISYFLVVPNFTIFNFIAFVTACALLIGHHVFAHLYKLYKKAWEYASIGELIAILKAVSLSILFATLVQYVFAQDIYFRVLIVTWMMHILLIGGSRFSWRLLRDTYFQKQQEKKRALIVGAGSAGTMVVRQLQHNPDADLLPVAFIDDDRSKQDLEIMGIPVVGGRHNIKQVVEKYQIDNIVLAIPSLSKKELNEIYSRCIETQAKTQIIPMLEDLMTGKVSINQIRDVEVEDLLGRDPVELDIEGISDYIAGKTVLVTGAGGSIGSEICRQVVRFGPEKLLLLGHGENSIYMIDRELRSKYDASSTELIQIIADIQDRERIFEIMVEHRPDVVFHAAAHKHVPLMEANPKEAVKNNVIGTQNVAEAADRCQTGRFVLISTDKAVNPTSVMGATKRIAEMFIQSINEKSNTCFAAVRFGNVLGSRGSVIPLFKEQIQNGGPVTVTHPDMTRYFMTIPEASRLVIQAGALAQGGEIFVLDMGEPVKIVDLARNLINLSGFTEDEIRIEYTGIRPGEKLFEELLNENEIHEEQVYPKIYVGKSLALPWNTATKLLERLEGMEQTKLREALLQLANQRHVQEEAVL